MHADLLSSYAKCINNFIDGMISASVCPGGQINLTCHTAPNETLLQRTLTIPGRPQPELRFISSGGSVAIVSPLIVGQTVFKFLRTSTSPLISEIMIENVTTTLNGTRVECSYGSSVMSATIINVIGNGTCALLNIEYLH